MHLTIKDFGEILIELHTQRELNVLLQQRIEELEKAAEGKENARKSSDRNVSSA